MHKRSTAGSRFNAMAMVASGMLFGFGLAYSSMIQPEVVLSFLRWQDLGLLLVLGGALVVTLITYQCAPRWFKRPLLAEQFDKRAPPALTRSLTGAAIFGVGWGLCGVCPGPAIAGLGTGNTAMLLSLMGMALGAYVHGRTTNVKP